nr:alpha/beta hydrolase [Neorhizobium galegae]
MSRLPTPDGTRIALYEWGDKGLPPILLIHGIYQSALNWHRQFSAVDLTSRHRVVAIDLRGHGASDKPGSADHYRKSRCWADDIRTVIEQAELRRPALVGWSYGGRVINDYLSVYGDSALGGLVYVGARTATGIPGETRHSEGVAQASRNAKSEDPVLFMKGTRQFTRICFHRAPPRQELDALAMNSMQTPLYVRNHMVGRPLDYSEVLKSVRVPTLVVHGRKDRIVPFPVGEFTASAIASARLEAFDDAGHSPFAEAPERFNRLLDAFMQQLLAD